MSALTNAILREYPEVCGNAVNPLDEREQEQLFVPLPSSGRCPLEEWST